MLLAACAARNQAPVSPVEYYAAFTAQVQARGGYRTERATVDAPFTNADLIRNFELIALYDEYDNNAPGFVESQSPSRLSRWEGPLNIKMVGERGSDRKALYALGRRLAAATQRAVNFTNNNNANVNIYVLDAVDRATLVSELAAEVGEEDMLYLKQWANDNLYPCFVSTYRTDETRPGVITEAHIFVKNELEGVLRKSCFHEELTQAMGLGNDHPDVRPSMFNDDEEFAFLTEHDEFLLRILYHPDLSPDMDADDVRPLLPAIVAEIRPEPGS